MADSPTKEFFVRAASFGAPFFSDVSEEYIKAPSPEAALVAFAKDYKHPAGLYSAAAYASADAYHHGEGALAQWQCNYEIAKRKASADKGACTVSGHGDNLLEIDGEPIVIRDPHEGQIISPEM